MDLVIRGATVVDGTGRERFAADVAVNGDRIVQVGEVADTGRKEIDAGGLCLAPGFIDMHSHTDHYLLVNPAAESKVTQGVTTEVCGNCGSSSAPLMDPVEREDILGWLSRNGVDTQWTSVADLFSLLEGNGIGVNFMTFVGHGLLRAAVVGYDDRPATPDELARMRELVRQSLEEGAVGVSSGLIYPPGCYGSAHEITEICRPVGAMKGLYSTHMRSEGDFLVESVDETIAIGEGSGARVQISHHKACSPQNWGKVKTTLERIEAANRRGVSVTADQYPYIATCTSLSANLPRWAHDGGTEKLLERLEDPTVLPRLQEETSAAVEAGYSDPMQGWRDVVVSSVRTDANKWVEGQNLEEIARQWNARPVDAMVRLLLEEKAHVSMVHFTISEDDVETVMRKPYVMVGSDATARALSGPLAYGKPHPRTFGTMPRVLAHYVRERGILTLEDAVRKMTSLPAGVLGLSDRGTIAEGYIADMVLFDPDNVKDIATFAEPFQLATGIPYVFVNGVAVVRDNVISGDLPGRCLRFQGLAQ